MPHILISRKENPALDFSKISKELVWYYYLFSSEGEHLKFLQKAQFAVFPNVKLERFQQIKTDTKITFRVITEEFSTVAVGFFNPLAVHKLDVEKALNQPVFFIEADSSPSPKVQDAQPGQPFYPGVG